jgi:hypothetical protein
MNSRLSEIDKGRLLHCNEDNFEITASLHDEDIFVLVDILKSKTDIQYLNLTANQITENGVIRIS